MYQDYFESFKLKIIYNSNFLGTKMVICCLYILNELIRQKKSFNNK